MAKKYSVVNTHLKVFFSEKPLEEGEWKLESYFHSLRGPSAFHLGHFFSVRDKRGSWLADFLQHVSEGDGRLIGPG